MKNKFNRFMQDQSGVTALETAIILIAFVVVAAVFAFTMLTTGTFLTERSKEAALAGVSQVRGSMEVRGSVLLTADATQMAVPVAPACDGDGTSTINVAQTVAFTLSNVAGGSPIDLTDTIGKQVTTITYRDQYQTYDLNAITGTNKIWTVSWIGKSNGDNILETGELAQITVDLSKVTGMDTACPLGPNRTFTIEIKPPNGAVLSMQRTTPARIDLVTDLQ